ncbi:MAG TPA: PadR family transcriptional regulator [Thermoplasmata archaeon]|nr:PadR family transcriptional regulator [Thermoplasmata archaeon]
MAKQNNTRLAILGFLHYRDMHGYEIKKTIEKWMPSFWSINYGSIYPELKKLEKEGCIEGRREETLGNPPRTTYTLTHKGKDEFRKLVRTGLEREPIVKDEFNLYAAFFDYLNEGDVKGYIKRRRELHEKALKEAITGEKALRGETPKYLQALARRALHHYKAEIDWLKEVEEMQNENK